MSEPAPLPRSVTGVATESAERSIESENEVVGDRPDEGRLVDEDHAQ